ncbi:CBN-SPP-10 protein [Caenorhabditis brenneri]|uniref:CBN-SPP-10 protein n=1 Tax=Caenorhabditis brenneri TaxID=135651 RepID=G0P9X0_CAEBE|nr:CBN-SPP-10 protein [Caenorhabditis brenneri]
MKTLILALALFATTALAYSKQSMLESNRVMSDAIQSSSCDECQLVVKKFSDAAQDPKKIEELKIVLGMMCRETSYAEECRLFVSQLDKFIDKLQPYLKDAKAFCARLHICSNKKIDAFRRILLEMVKRAEKIYSVPGIVCDECEFVVKELKTVVEDKKSQAEARDFLRENVCKSLGQYRGFCDLVVDEYLPQFIQELDAILADPHQVCVDIKACNAGDGFKARKYVEYSDEDKERVENEVETFWNGLTMKNNKGQVLAMSCFECKFVVDDMQQDMIGNRKKLSDDVRDFACYHIVTANMTASCIDFLDLYLPTVIQMTIEQVTPEGVCQANKCCPKDSVSALRDFSFSDIQFQKCSTMVALEAYMTSNLVGSPVEKFLENSLTDSICSHSISYFKATCQQIMSSVSPRLVSLTAVLAQQNKFSKAVCSTAK